MRTTGIVLILAAAAFAGGKPPIKNGGFEKGMRDWLLANNSGNSRYDFDKKNKMEGCTGRRRSRRDAVSSRSSKTS